MNPESESRPGGLPALAALARLPATLDRALRDFFHYQGLVQASSLAYFALLSFIPLIFMVLAIAGMVWGDTQEVQLFVEEQAALLTPWGATAIHSVFVQVIEKASGIGWLSLVLILWASGLFFATLQQTLRLPWKRERLHETGIWRFVMPWLLGPALGFALTLVMLVTHLVGYLPPGALPVAVRTTGWSILAMLLMVWLLYRIVLPYRGHVGVMLVVALAIAVASQGITVLYAEVITQLPNYSIVYGPIAGIVLFLLWIDFNLALILLGGHLIRIWPETSTHPARRSAPR